MKTACFIPIKGSSKRVYKKNTRSLSDRPLFTYVLDEVLECDVFDDIFVDTDSDTVKKYCENKNIKIIDRDPELIKDSANGNDLLVHWAKIKPDYDLYFQVFVTSPFLSTQTLEQTVSVLKTHTEYDSVFTAVEEHTWFWYDDKAVNYDPKVLPRSQDARPLIKETTSLYGITRESLLEGGSRIGNAPYIYLVDSVEAIDIDNQFDFFVAEQIQNGLKSSSPLLENYRRGRKIEDKSFKKNGYEERPEDLPY